VRNRIVGLTVLAAVLATCLFGIPFAIATGRYFMADEQRELERTADVVALAVSGDLARARHTGGLPAHEPGLDVSVYTAAGTRVTGPGPQHPDGLVRRALNGIVSSADAAGRLAAAVPVSDGDTVVGAVLISATKDQVYARIARTWALMLGVALAAIAVTWLVAHRLSRRIAGPVECLAQAAEQLGGGDFTVRTERSGIAEIDLANQSLARTARRLGDLVDRERAFSADASHQLRTPLSGLQLSLEAALDAPGADLRAAITGALGSTRELERTITDLLALARDRPGRAEALDLDTLLTNLHARWNGLLAQDDRPLRILRDPGLPQAFMSASACRQILDVLIDNARRHGKGAVSVIVRDAEGALAIDVSDEGEGITSNPHELFQRRGANAHGTGIGLSLARRLAESEGCRLVLSTPTPPRFTLLAPTQEPEHSQRASQK